MKLKQLLISINITQPYEIWFQGNKVIDETTDLDRYCESKGAPEDLVEKNLSSEVKKIYFRKFCWKKKNKGSVQLMIDMEEWRTE